MGDTSALMSQERTHLLRDQPLSSSASSPRPSCPCLLQGPAAEVRRDGILGRLPPGVVLLVGPLLLTVYLSGREGCKEDGLSSVLTRPGWSCLYLSRRSSGSRQCLRWKWLCGGTSCQSARECPKEERGLLGPGLGLAAKTGRRLQVVVAGQQAARAVQSSSVGRKRGKKGGGDGLISGGVWGWGGVGVVNVW